MPPIRTGSGPKAPAKTQRTHEENQERAYIAASRRTDRSIDARMESARRASEIHYRRTGRALRITEEAVLNEEMYDEEDDDLASRYTRLAVHLQGLNMEHISPRLRAYLSASTGVRAQLLQQLQHNGIYPTSAAQQRYPNAPSFVSPVLQTEMTQQQRQLQLQQYQQQQQQDRQQHYHPYQHQRPQEHHQKQQLHQQQQQQQQQQIHQQHQQHQLQLLQPQQGPEQHVKQQSPEESKELLQEQQQQPSPKADLDVISPVMREPNYTHYQAAAPAAATSTMSQEIHPSYPVPDGTDNTSISPLTTSLPTKTEQFFMPVSNLYDPYMPSLDASDPSDFNKTLDFSLEGGEILEHTDGFVPGAFSSGDGADGFLAGTLFDSNIWNQESL